jgi:hypothetical protein
MIDHLIQQNDIVLEDYNLNQLDLTFIKELIYGGGLKENYGNIIGRTRKDQQFLYEIVNNSII